MKKFRQGKIYSVKESSDWGVYVGNMLTTMRVSTTERLVYYWENDCLMSVGGDFYIANANKYTDKFEPYITQKEAEKYKDSEMRSAERALQGLLSNPSLVLDENFSYKGMARVACQIATALVREMIDEEYYDEEE